MEEPAVKWVTKPEAVRLVWQLNGLQVGDLVETGMCPVDPTHNEGHDEGSEKRTLVILDLQDGDEPRWPIVARDIDGGIHLTWNLCPCSIKAWLRPTEEKQYG